MRSRFLVAASMLAAVACATGEGDPPREPDGPRIAGVELLARSSERPSGLMDVGGQWSPHDYHDSIVVRVRVVSAGGPTMAPGTLRADVLVAAAPVVWADADETVTDLDRMRENAVWLPSVESHEVALARGRAPGDSVAVDVAVITPAWIGERIAAGSPGTEAVRLAVRVFLLAPGAEAGTRERWVERTIELNLVD